MEPGTRLNIYFLVYHHFTLSQPRGAWGDLTTRCNVESWMGSWDRKRPSGKPQGIWVEYELQLILLYPYWFISVGRQTTLT